MAKYYTYYLLEIWLYKNKYNQQLAYRITLTSKKKKIGRKHHCELRQSYIVPIELNALLDVALR